MEEEMATYFTILAWKIPWMKEPGRLQQYMGSQRVRHDRVVNTFTFQSETHLLSVAHQTEPLCG